MVSCENILKPIKRSAFASARRRHLSSIIAGPHHEPAGLEATANAPFALHGNTLTYDAWNPLVQVTDPAGQIIAKYSYNAMGYRISESYPQGGNGVAAGTVKYLYYSNNWQVLETRWNGTAATDVAHQYVWSQMYIDAMVLRDTYSSGAIQPDARIYTQFDANYNVTALIGYNASTNTWGVVQRYVYTPYGVATVLDANWNATTDQFAWQYMHQGGRLDPVTGLYDFRNRDYSPTLGNWIEQDPAGYVDGGNRYQIEDGATPGNLDGAGTAKTSSSTPKMPGLPGGVAPLPLEPLTTLSSSSSGTVGPASYSTKLTLKYDQNVQYLPSWLRSPPLPSPNLPPLPQLTPPSASSFKASVTLSLSPIALALTASSKNSFTAKFSSKIQVDRVSITPYVAGSTKLPSFEPKITGGASISVAGYRHVTAYVHFTAPPPYRVFTGTAGLNFLLTKSCTFGPSINYISKTGAVAGMVVIKWK